MRHFILLIATLLAACANADPREETIDGAALGIDAFLPPVDASTPPGDPGDEICNGFDDDRDGVVDEDCPCGSGAVQECYPAPPMAMIEPCAMGEQQCEGSGEFGAWGECVGAILPTTEVCGDGVDQDCNGADLPCDCTPMHHQGCHQGDVYWFDSCDNLGALHETCERGCLDGACLPEPSDCASLAAGWMKACDGWTVGNYDVDLEPVGPAPSVATLNALLLQCEAFCEATYTDVTCCSAVVTSGEDFMCVAARGPGVTFVDYDGLLDWAWASNCY